MKIELKTTYVMSEKAHYAQTSRESRSIFYHSAYNDRLIQFNRIEIVSEMFKKFHFSEVDDLADSNRFIIVCRDQAVYDMLPIEFKFDRMDTSRMCYVETEIPFYFFSPTEKHLQCIQRLQEFDDQSQIERSVLYKQLQQESLNSRSTEIEKSAYDKELTGYIV